MADTPVWYEPCCSSGDDDRCRDAVVAVPARRRPPVARPRPSPGSITLVFSLSGFTIRRMARLDMNIAPKR